MGREIVLFESEEKSTRSETVAVLREIADKLEAGSLTLTSGEKQIELEIPEPVVLELKVEEEEKKAV